ncbi:MULTISPECIES: DNA gyrase subunit A [Acidiphilium]|uniref:DNA gyrase subunit A n=1 Tax=Acidiphilium multivorum (strain DSM 11245 / JCM 8867 / NBRC 100883 / AIU 301) TaxID=926570 RepID=F0J4M2_ACIMA|nr:MULTISPECIES: DNA gyrase subunit A [Acidiphilium]MBU6356957.1 DNA gyrase subunit A [Rhodospirillales bacterium]KDM66775.1 DNA gyrase subunit A [Acidiphilium sp. JA12-A1]MBS3025156.1 DNA gyrase subunit A [Acidiphilium multivorum]BAJ80074.1 DNA gyrase subunit A [Acidiphilium multivorum AIU301]GAN75483.1 DNA gyrase subunit A [Acidiphilium multivorum AIU301]
MTDTTDQTEGPSGQVPVTIEQEMRRSYLDYAMSVIVSRALPDARDGLKPVHRRILYAMQEAGNTPDKPYRKSARMVGDVMGKYHPHGDAAIYDAAVRMAQGFSMRVPLIDGQGNFGSVDGDPPAAMRYTEARLADAAMALLADIDKDTVDFQPTYDESDSEPRVLPAAFPNLLVNGGNGIAVGMATNIPPHNPAEIIDATLHLIAQPEATLDDLMRIVPGPDFPTGGIILGRSGIRSAFETGRGGIVVRARTSIEEIRKDRMAIIVSELPYQVNKATLLERIAELVRAKEIEGIADLRDESDREGMRMVIELKRDATPEVVLNHLYRFTQMQTGFGINMLALDGGRPRQLGLRDALDCFIAFREDVILRRSRFELNKARDRAHLLVGLGIAVANIDEVIALIRAAPDAASARIALMARDWPAGDVRPLLELIDDHGNQISADGTVRLTEAQARGILELRLQRLTGLEREKIQSELAEVGRRIGELLEIIASRPRRLEVMRDELLAVRARIAAPRLTSIEDSVADQDDESLIEPGQMVVTMTRDGFIKRTPLEAFRAQNRGGRGRAAASMRGDDVITRSFNAHTHQFVLFFSQGGKAFREKVWRLPESAPAAKGRAIVNILPELNGDAVTAVLPLPQDESLWNDLHLVFATASGNVRRNRLADFRNVRSTGLIAMKLDDGDRLIGVATCREGDDVFLATRQARCIRFQITDDTLRVFAGRDSSGVRGIRLGAGDEVISLSVLRHVEASVDERAAYLKYAAAQRRAGGEEGELDAVESDEAAADIQLTPERIAALQSAEEMILTVTTGGFGKLSSAYEYRVTGRGGQGIANIALAARNGRAVAASFPVRPGDDIMLVTDQGKLIRAPVDQVRITGRQAMGVTLVRVEKDEQVTSVFPVLDDGGDEAGEEQDG